MRLIEDQEVKRYIEEGRCVVIDNVSSVEDAVRCACRMRPDSIIVRRGWIPCKDRLPEIKPFGCSDYVLVSPANYTIPDIGRYEGGKWYPGDDEKPYEDYGIEINAWMPLPTVYREAEKCD